MPEIILTVDEATVNRLRTIASEKDCSVQDVILLFLNYAIETHDTAKTPEEIQEYHASLTPSRPRPVIDRARIQAIVDKYKPADPNDQTG